MHLDMHQALRCHAQSKRSGLQCRAPAVRGYASAGCMAPAEPLLEGTATLGSMALTLPRRSP